MTNSEMTIPKARGEALGAALLSAFVVGTCMIGVRNLKNGEAVIFSVFWIFIVAAILLEWLKNAGIRRMLIDYFDCFAARRFLLYSADSSSPGVLRLGYEIFGYRILHTEIPIGSVDSVKWSSGQATAMARRDMADWNVVLWYDHGDPEKSLKNQRLKHPDQDLVILGPSGSRESIRLQGLTVVEFLRRTGVCELIPEADDNGFARATLTQEKGKNL